MSSRYKAFRRKLIGGYCIVCVLILGVIGAFILTAYETSQRDIRFQTQALAIAIESHVQNSIEFMDLTLISLSEVIRALPAEKRSSPDAIGALLTPYSASGAKNFFMSYTGADGIGIAASSGLEVRGVSYAEREHFQVHASGRHAGLYVGGPAIGKLTGGRIFFLSRRVESADGQFLGVVSSVVDAAKFLPLFKNVRASENVSITLAHTQGKVITRYPLFEQSFAASLEGTEFFKRSRTEISATYKAVSLMDKELRIFSYRVMPQYPLMINVGVSAAAWNDALKKNLTIGSAGFVCIGLLMLFSGSIALRAYARIEQRKDRFHALYAEVQRTKEELSRSEKRLQTITDNVPAMIGYIDRETRYRFCSKAYEKHAGIEAEKLIGRTLAEVWGEERRRELDSHIKQVLGGKRDSFERMVPDKGKNHYFHFDYIPDIESDGQVAGFYSMVTNITGRKHNEVARDKDHELLSAILDTIEVGIVACDENGILTLFNRSTRDFHRLGKPDAPPENWADHYQLFHPDGVTPMENKDIPLFRALRGERVKNEGMVIVSRDGLRRDVSASGRQMRGKDGRNLGAVLAMTDITTAKEAEQKLWLLARADPLTQLPNRFSLYEHLDQAATRSQRTGLPLALLFIDLDHFKSVNDSLGHQGGDAVLKEFAARMSACVRKTDLVARLAGDEFVIVLEGLTAAEDSQQVAKKIIGRMALPFDIGGDTLKLSASIGITIHHGGNISHEELLRQADQALYRAKAEGRNNFNVFAADVPQVPTEP